MQKYAWNDDAKVDLTPMLDIVFIMLIFFIVTATFTNEYGLQIPSVPPVPGPPDDPGIVMRVDGNNQVFYVDPELGSRLIDPRRVRANIERAHAVSPNAGVIIQAAAAADTGLVVSVYDAVLTVDKSIPIAVARID